MDEKKRTTPLKTPKKIEFDGVRGDLARLIHGKILLHGEPKHRVIYENGGKYFYFSFNKHGELLKRPCSMGQVDRIEALTPDESRHLGVGV